MTESLPAYRKIVAIVRRIRLPAIEDRLCCEGVAGITVTPVKGFGEYANAFARDLLVPHVRLDVYVAADDVDRLVAAIVDAARTGEPGDGFVAVEPVLAITHILSGKPFTVVQLGAAKPATR